MSAGERGPVGDHGQAGDVGRRGEKGEKGERGMNPLLVRHATLAYVVLAVGLILTVIVSQNNANESDERLRAALQAFERESIATDQAFCVLTNRTFAEINRTRDASRKAYSLLIPPPTADRAAAERLVRFREDLLATIDGNLPQLDCSGIGNGKVDFSIQDAIRNGTISTPTTTRPPG